MADQEERITYKAVDETADATKSANRNIESIEKSAEQATEAINAAMANQGKALVTVTDRGAKRIEAMIARVRDQASRLDPPLTRMYERRAKALSQVTGSPEKTAELTGYYDKLLKNEQNILLLRQQEEANDTRVQRQKQVTAALEETVKKENEIARVQANNARLQEDARNRAIRAAEAQRAEQRKALDDIQKRREKTLSPEAQRTARYMRERRDAADDSPAVQKALRETQAAELRNTRAAAVAAQQKQAADQAAKAAKRSADQAAQEARNRDSIVSRVTRQAQSPLQRLYTERATDVGALQGHADQVNKVTAAYDRLILKQKQLNAREWANDLYRFGQAWTIGVTIPLVTAAYAAIKTDQSFRKATNALTVMTGSAEEAGKLMADLKKFSLQTPFEFKDILPEAQRLKALGFQAKELIPIMTAVSAAVAGVGGNEETFGRITLALGQMTSKQRVMAQEMNQLTEALIPAWDILAKKLKVDVPEAFKRVENGAVSASVAVPAILEEMLKRFGVVLSKQNQELSGRIIFLKNQFTFMLAEIGVALEPMAMAFVRWALIIVRGIKGLVEWFSHLNTAQKAVAGAFAALIVVIGPVALAISGLARTYAVLYGIELLVTRQTTALAAAETAAGTAAVRTAGTIGMIATIAGSASLAILAMATAWDVWQRVTAASKSKTPIESFAVGYATDFLAAQPKLFQRFKAPPPPPKPQYGPQAATMEEQVKYLQDTLKKDYGQELPQGKADLEDYRDSLLLLINAFKGGQEIVERMMKGMGGPAEKLKQIADQQLSALRSLQEARAQQMDPMSRISEEMLRQREELAKTVPLTQKTNALLNERERILVAAERRRVQLEGDAERRSAPVEREGAQIGIAYQAGQTAISARISDTYTQQVQIEEATAELQNHYLTQKLENDKKALYNKTAAEIEAAHMSGDEQLNVWRKYRNERDMLDLQGNAAIEDAQAQSYARLVQMGHKYEQDLEQMHVDNAVRRIELQQDTIDTGKRRAMEHVNLDEISAVTVDQKRDIEQRKAAIEVEYTVRSTQLQLDVLHEQSQRQMDLVKTDSRKQAEIEVQYQLDAQKIIDQGWASLDQTRIDAAQKTAEHIRQIDQETFNRFKSESNSAFDAMFRKGQTVLEGMKNFVRNALLTMAKDIGSSQIAKFLTELTTGRKVDLINPAHPGGFQGALGKLGLGGVPIFNDTNRRVWDEKPNLGPATPKIEIPQLDATATGIAKLNAPEGISDWRMVGGAMPVVIQGLGPQVATASLQAAGAAAAIGPWLLRGLNGGGDRYGATTKIGDYTDYESGASLGGESLGIPAGLSIGPGADQIRGGLGASIPGFGQNGIYEGTEVASGTSGAASKLGGLGQLASGYKGILGALTKLGNLGRGTGMIPRGIGGVTGGLMLAGGGVLAFDGLRRGGVKGLAETTAGGALIGAKFGGPLGALIGGAVGLGAGLIRLSIKGAPEKIIEKVKAIYGITIDKPFATQLAKRIHDNYGGDIDLGIRAPEIRSMLQLYAQSRLTTEDAAKFPLTYQPYDVGVKLSGGQMTQTAAMSNGSAIAYGGGTLGTSGPVNKLITGTQQGAFMPSTLVVQNLSLSLNGQSAVDAMTGAVASNPEVVGNASLAANNQRVGGRATQASLTPGLITG